MKRPEIHTRGVASSAGALRWTFDVRYPNGWQLEAFVDSTRLGTITGIHAETSDGTYYGTTGDGELDDRLAAKVQARVEFERHGRTLRAGAA